VFTSDQNDLTEISRETQHQMKTRIDRHQLQSWLGKLNYSYPARKIHTLKIKLVTDLLEGCKKLSSGYYMNIQNSETTL
jgi:hypothetical protein